MTAVQTDERLAAYNATLETIAQPHEDFVPFSAALLDAIRSGSLSVDGNPDAWLTTELNIARDAKSRLPSLIPGAGSLILNRLRARGIVTPGKDGNPATDAEFEQGFSVGVWFAHAALRTWKRNVSGSDGATGMPVITEDHLTARTLRTAGICASQLLDRPDCDGKKTLELLPEGSPARRGVRWLLVACIVADPHTTELLT